MDSSKINFEKKAVLLVTLNGWTVTNIHAGCMTEKNSKLE